MRKDLALTSMIHVIGIPMPHPWPMVGKSTFKLGSCIHGPLWRAAVW
ncbi:MAG: hypothetical protein JRE38_07095 [Deltaproteobacteria bacterium]|nr:hypothetical protein [Deltaproteobacteria bacterium]